MPYSTKISVEENTSVVWLVDEVNNVQVAVVPSFGNRTIRMLVNGENILHFPFESLTAAKGDRSLNGIPFLAPWANRMAGGGVGNYRFNETTGTLRMDANGLPIHGMLTVSPLWELHSIGADQNGAHVTSRLEFWEEPSLMANWPWAHTYEMTHTLKDGALEITTTIENHSSEKMPVSIGFHPYFRLPGAHRDDISIHLPVHQHVETDSRLIPTGEFKDVTFPADLSLKGQRFDDGFTGLEEDAVFSLSSGARKIEVEFGPDYQVAVIYAPPDKDFVCFEPMTAITNGINLAAEGKYPDLQWIEPRGEWTENFRINWQNL